MKEVSGREAMEALALGMALYNEDGTVADTFVRDRKFMSGEHLHAEVIRAFGNGEEVQFFDGDKWVTTGAPGFYRDHKYRVKPDARMQEGNTLLLSDGSLWTVTTAQKLHEMFGLSKGGEEPVAFRQADHSRNGISWDRLAYLLKVKDVTKVFVAPKNRE